MRIQRPIPPRGRIAQLLLPLLCLVAAWAAAAGPARAQGGLLTGWLRAAVECGPGRDAYTYVLDDGAGHSIPLALNPRLLASLGGVQTAVGKRVAVQGTLGPVAQPGTGLVRGVRVGRIALAPASGDVGISAVSGPQPYVVILTYFAGETPPATQGDLFRRIWGSAQPSVDHFWRETSYGQVDMANSVVIGPVSLPSPRSSYVNAQGVFDRDRAASEALTGVDAQVNFPSFEGISIVFQFNASIAGTGSIGRWSSWFRDGQFKNYRVNWIYTGGQQLGTVAHEVGHSLGFPHSSGPYGETYDSRWDLMSYSRAISDPDVGYRPVGTIGYHKDLAGWISPERRVTVSVGAGQVIRLERLCNPTESGVLLARVPIGAGGTFYTVEARKRLGYDAYLPGAGVIIHHVDPLRDSDAWVMDGDENGDPNDAGAIWLPGESFTDDNSVTISVLAVTATGYVVLIQNGPASSYALAGAISENGVGVPGVSVTAGGQTTTTDASGVYVFTGLVPGDYTVVPEKSGYGFSPSSRPVLLTDTQGGVDFLAYSAFEISGTVREDGTGLEGVAVSLGSSADVAYSTFPNLPIPDANTTGIESAVTVTADGQPTYLEVGVNINHTYIGDLEVSLIHPDGTAVLLHNGTGDDDDDLITTYPTETTPAGNLATLLNRPAAGIWKLRVRDLVSGDTGFLGGWSLSLRNASSRSTSTASDGTFHFSGVRAGTYPLVPTKPGLGFLPSIRSVSVGPDRSAQDFNATPQFRIRGTVRYPSGAPISGVLVTAATRTTTTSATGTYEIAELTAGTYNVTVTRSGFVFPIPTRSVMGGPDQENIDFVGTDGPILTGFTLKSGTVKGGKPGQATLTFSKPFAAAVRVAVSSSRPELVTLPSGGAPIAKRKSVGSFQIKTKKVATQTDVVLTATYEGSQLQRTLTLVPTTSR